MEPGEAVVLNAGFLVAKVLEIVNNEMEIAILTLLQHAICLMVEMPYRPPLLTQEPGEKPYTYRLAGPTCLPGILLATIHLTSLKEGDELVFEDMALCTMVKPIPSTVCLYRQSFESCRRKYHIVRTFSYGISNQGFNLDLILQSEKPSRLYYRLLHIEVLI